MEDVSSGLTAVDKGNVELYLKVIAQITTLYKAETSTMLFGGKFILFTSFVHARWIIVVLNEQPMSRQPRNSFEILAFRVCLRKKARISLVVSRFAPVTGVRQKKNTLKFQLLLSWNQNKRSWDADPCKNKIKKSQRQILKNKKKMQHEYHHWPHAKSIIKPITRGTRQDERLASRNFDFSVSHPLYHRF